MTEHRSAAEVVAGLDLRGKVCLVTGVSSGLGAETARVLAGAGATVVGTARDVAKARAAVGDPSVEIGELELDSLASVLFALELDRRLAARGVRANALHPGGIRTELGRHLTPESIQEMMARFKLRGGPVQFKDVAHGAATQVWAAVSPELDGVGGRYLEDVHIGVPVRGETDGSGY